MHDNHRKALSKDFLFIIFLIGFCSCLGLFWRLLPILDLFNHFRMQAIVGSFLCALTFLWLKNKKGFLISLLILLLNAGIVGYKLHYTGGIPSLAEKTGKEISIISSNVLTSNTDYASVLAMVEKQNPDVIVFSEVDDVWVKALETIEQTYPYYYQYPRPDNFGLAAYSKTPFKATLEFAGQAKLPILILDYNEFLLMGVHPLPPASTPNISENFLYLSRVAELADSYKDRPLIIAGDMNSTLWSAAIKPIIDNGFSRIHSLGIAYTWPKNNWLWGLQIDNFFGKNIVAGDFQVLPSIGSDHYPIRADVKFAD